MNCGALLKLGTADEFIGSVSLGTATWPEIHNLDSVICKPATITGAHCVREICEVIL